jgi:hypothetical protein
MSYVIVALAPFQWDPPGWIDNGAVRGDRGTIRFGSPGMAQTWQHPAWTDRAMALNEITVHLRVRSSSTNQKGPARIFTFSTNPYHRNLTIGQENADLSIRLRTPATSPNGLPPHTISSVFSRPGWREIQLAIEPTQLVAHVDGRRVLSEPLPRRPLETWDRDFRLALGNELTGDRPWLGEISSALVTVGDQQFDCLESGVLELPLRFRKRAKFQFLTPEQARTQDLLLNFVCFIPLGFVLATIGGRRTMMVLAVVICAAASFCVEFAQIFFAYRMPSVSDWISNSLGGFVGALVAWSCAAANRRRAAPRVANQN